MADKKKPFVLLVVLFATVLLLLSFWVIRQNSSKPGESLLIHDVVISTEVDDTRRLTGVVSRFPYGSRQICMRFNYSKAPEGAEIRILWFMGDKLVQSDSYVLPASYGSRIYCLTLENGQPLPKGSYSVGILSNAERISDFRFEIY
ncbi:MAG: hypothetical protein FWG71_05600 [Synergistaceae bacterium]|nr:hypothetical protein [Synergistaceae bacterium]